MSLHAIPCARVDLGAEVTMKDKVPFHFWRAQKGRMDGARSILYGVCKENGMKSSQWREFLL